jgi:hypothetical protein
MPARGKSPSVQLEGQAVNHLGKTLIFSLLLWLVSAAFAKPAVEVGKGRDVGDGMVLYDCPYDPKKVNEITFVAPSVEYPYYEIVIPLGDWTEGKSAALQTVTVNGISCESFYVFVDGFSHVQSAWVTNKVATAKNVVLVARAVWHNNEKVTLDAVIGAVGEDGKPVKVTKNFSGTAPGKGGGLEGWRRYQSFVVREKAGLERQNEPVEFSITVRAEDCVDLSRELRLCSLEKGSHALSAAPFQTFNAREFGGTPPGTPDSNYLQHPSRVIEAITPVSIEANQSRVYVVFYDNPKSEAKAAAKSDLAVAGPSLGATIENWNYRVKLSDQCGQIASFDLLHSSLDGKVLITEKGATEKPGSSRGDLPSVPRLTNSLSRAVHWNPDSFSDNGLWGHTFSWDPPDRTEVTTRGPLLFRITNSGRMPGDTPQVDVSVTYSFYPGVPYVLATSVLKVRDTLNASAIRDGEIVLDSHLITHFVWKEKTGEIKTTRTLHGANWQDEWGYRVDTDVPWIAMTNEGGGYGVGTAIVNAQAFNPTHGEATLHRPAFYLYYHHFWNTPLTYFTRAWVYPFSDYQRGPIIPVAPDSTYVSRAAFMPFRLHGGGNRYQEIDEVSKRLLNPLELRWGR